MKVVKVPKFDLVLTMLKPFPDIQPCYISDRTQAIKHGPSSPGGHSEAGDQRGCTGEPHRSLRQVAADDMSDDTHYKVLVRLGTNGDSIPHTKNYFLVHRLRRQFHENRRQYDLLR